MNFSASSKASSRKYVFLHGPSGLLLGIARTCIFSATSLMPLIRSLSQATARMREGLCCSDGLSRFFSTRNGNYLSDPPVRPLDHLAPRVLFEAPGSRIEAFGVLLPRVALYYQVVGLMKELPTLSLLIPASSEPHAFREKRQQELLRQI